MTRAHLERWILSLSTRSAQRSFHASSQPSMKNCTLKIRLPRTLTHFHSFSFSWFYPKWPKCLERVLRTRFATLYSPTCDFRNRGNSRINRLWQNYRRRISGNFKLAFPVWNRSLIEDGSHYRFSHTKFDGPLLDGHGKGIMDKVVTWYTTCNLWHDIRQPNCV